MARAPAAIGVGIWAAAALAGCDDPSWRDPATSHGTSQLPPEVARIVATADAQTRARRAGDHLLQAPLPPPPDWASGLIGQGLRAAFPRLGDCLGNTDGVRARYMVGAGGSRVAGWGWDPTSNAPIAHVVLVDHDAVIRGAGNGGYRRIDVPRNVKSVTSEMSGWEADTSVSAGPIDVWGVLADGHTICRLGRVDL